MQQAVVHEGPRERLAMHGEEALSDVDLLAVLLGTGSRREPVGVLAARVMAHAGGLDGLRRMGVRDLAACVGIGPTKACRLRAALELGARAVSQPLSSRESIRSSRDVDRALRPRLRDATREHFMAVALDVRNRPVAVLEIAVGGLASCTVSPADVFREVVRHAAAAVVLAHNHPSGDCAPSDEDVAITERLRQAGELVGVRVLDHLILGHDGYFSFLDAGLLGRRA
jgi:DNA repair protein RadC